MRPQRFATTTSYLALILLLLLLHDATSSSDDDDDDVVEYNGIECDIYFAPSTIPGAGYGLFAGRSYREKEFVTPGDLVVPAVELEWHNGYGNTIVNLWEDYQWSASTFGGMESEAEGDHIAGYSFGIGAVPNCFHPMINLEILATRMDSAGLHRSRDPGAGAITPYHNRKSYAYIDIPAGSELFVDYGSDYFPSREYLYGPIPAERHYRTGDVLMKKYKKLRDGTPSIEQICSVEKETCIAQPTEDFGHAPLSMDVQSTLLDTIQSLGDIWESHVIKTLPVTPEHVDYVLERGTWYLYQNRSIQSQEWLQENGVCMDNIQAEPSTIKQAGRGGFATRFIPKGHVVTAVPLIHIPNRTIFTMYGAKDGVQESDPLLVRNTSMPIHHQLMLNYCFGHRHSSLLLCPYGILNMVINHSKIRANVKVVWSKRGTRHPEWFDEPIESWGETTHAGLAFEYVATRNIREGDEILLDYGDEWEAAWQKHVAEWTPIPNSESYATSYELNRRLDDPILTVDEGFYADDKHFYCREEYRRMRGFDADEASNQLVHPCKVVFRTRNRNGEYRYIAHIFFETFDENDENIVLDTTDEYLFDLPRDAFFFQDVEYTRDHALEQTFRHDIRIPDDIMPKAWLDLLDSIDDGTENANGLDDVRSE